MAASQPGLPHSRYEADVVIVGAGPVGLTLAAELGRRGVRCILVEKRRSVSMTESRCRQVNVRSMELYRRIGVAQRIRSGSEIPFGWGDRVVFCTTLLGEELHTFDNAFYLSAVTSDVYPEPAQWIPQYSLERELRRYVLELPAVTFLTGGEVRFIDEGATGVRATVATAAGPREVAGSYLIGCDGARSVVRASLGVKMVGGSATYANVGVVFQCPGLRERNRLPPAAQYWAVNPMAPGLLGNLDLDDLWWAFLLNADPAMQPAEAAALLQQAIGDDVPVEVVKLDPWIARMLLGEVYGRGRVFLAGDAAHLNPPWGGWGANTGIGDAVDLAWKLAARLAGWGGNSILDHYETERRPIAEYVIRKSVENMEILPPELVEKGVTDEGPAGARIRAEITDRIKREKAAEFYSLGLQLGRPYVSPLMALPGEPGTLAPDAGNGDSTVYVPRVETGRRLPHQWLSPGRALYDELDREFTLIVGDQAPDPSPVVSAARTRGMPLRVLPLPPACAGPVFGRRESILVRPDMYVAWHGETLPPDVTGLLDKVRGQT